MESWAVLVVSDTGCERPQLGVVILAMAVSRWADLY